MERSRLITPASPLIPALGHGKASNCPRCNHCARFQFWRNHILRALDTETYFRQRDPTRVRDAALVHVAVIEQSETRYHGPLRVEGTEFPAELILRGVTVHLPLCILAAIPGPWRAESLSVSLGIDAIEWAF